MPIIDCFMKKTSGFLIFSDFSQELHKKIDKFSYINLISKAYINENCYKTAFCDIIDLLTIKNATIEFLDKLMIQVFSHENQITSEFFYINVLFENLEFFAEEAFCEGFEFFFKKRFILCKNLFLILKTSFWSPETCNSASFIDFLHDFKKEILLDIEKLLDFDDKNAYFLRNIDVFLSKIIWKIAVLLFFESEDLKNTIFWLCKVFINKLILLFSLMFLQENSEISLEKLIFSFENYDFRIKVISFLLPYFHLISAILFIIFGFEAAIIGEKLEKLDKNGEFTEQLAFFSSFFGGLFNLDLEILSFYGEKWLEKTRKMTVEKKTILSKEIAKNPCLKFSLPSFSSDFLGFYTKYINRKCEICEFFPRKKDSDLYLCLICEKVLCSFHCEKMNKNDNFHENVKINEKFNKKLNNKHKKNDEILNENVMKMGNLTRHAIECHAKKTVFVNLMDTKIIWIDVPTVFLEDFLFSDVLGQNMTRRSINWGDFILNNAKFERIRGLLVRREITQEIYYQLLRDPKGIAFTEMI